MKTEVHPSIDSISRQSWNSIVDTDYPFLSHEFLHLLEETSCVSPETGWQPLHVSVTSDAGEVLAVMPIYLKNHSRGEYVFDYSWADAWSRHGLSYYPKLVTAIPFSPVTGPRAGMPGHPGEHIPEVLLSGVDQLLAKTGASSWHMLFPDAGQSSRLEEAGELAVRTDVQYHWFNDGYQSFDDFLERCTSRRRKNLRKERRQVEGQGISFRRYEGDSIEDANWETFYRFYEATYFKRGMMPYLSEDFFRQLASRMPDSLVLFEAVKDECPVAMALCFRDRDNLYGRYWGCLEEYSLLHFEACYYQGIDYCIEKGLKRFDPGTQGEHKIARGFEPVEVRSLHKIVHPGFADAIRDFCRQESSHIRAYIEHARSLLPFKKEIIASMPFRRI